MAGALCLSPFAYLACSSDDDASPGAASDASADAVATTPGHATDSGLDASGTPGTDGAVDGGSDAAVTMTTLDWNGAARAGVTVVIHDATGAPLQTLTSDDGGVATGAVPAGGMVTAIYGKTVYRRLFTIAGVQPGDALTTRDPESEAAGSYQVQVNVPANPPTGTTQYLLRWGSCGDTPAAPFYGLDIPADCLPSSTATFVLLAANSGGVELGYTTLYDVQLSSPGNNVLAFAAPWSMAIPQTVALTHVPKPSSYLMYDVSSVSVNGPSYYESTTDGDDGASGSGGTVSLSVLAHPAGAAFQQTAVTVSDVFDSSEVNLATRTLVTRGPLPTGSTTTSFDVSTALPEITDAGFTQPDGSAAQVGWTSAAALAPASGIFVQMRWSDAADAGASRGTWNMLLPSSATRATFPTLPSALATYAPPSTAAYVTPPSIAAMGGSIAPTFTALREQAGVLALPPSLFNGSHPSFAPELPVDGTLSLTAFTASND